MNSLHATIEEFAADRYAHIECYCPRCRVRRLRPNLFNYHCCKAILIAMALCCVGGVTTKANPSEPFPTFTDGNELFDACEGFRTQGTLLPDEIMRFRYCEAYIVAVADTLGWLKAGLRASTGKSVKYCPPKGAESHQLTSVAVNYLRDHPEKRDQAAASLVANALAKGFPCN